MEDRRSYWVAKLEAAEQSGESLAAFCRREGLSYSAMQYWRRRLAAELDGAVGDQKKSAPRVRRGKRKPSSGLARVQVRHAAPRPRGAMVRLVVGDVGIEVLTGFDSETLSRVLDVVRAGGVR